MKTTAGLGLAMALVASVAFAQAPAGPPAGAPGAGRGARGPQVVSPEVGADKTRHAPVPRAERDGRSPPAASSTASRIR